jgi:hypothetical protein
MTARLKVAIGLLVTAAAILGGVATPAFAKSTETLTGPPRYVLAWQKFSLRVLLGDDAGAQPTSACLKVRSGPRGAFRWFGTWSKLSVQSRNIETGTFTVMETRPGTYTFLAVIRGYQLPTNPVTVVVVR